MSERKQITLLGRNDNGVHYIRLDFGVESIQSGSSNALTLIDGSNDNVNNYFNWLAYEVVKAEGSASTFDIGHSISGSYGDTDGWVDGGDANATIRMNANGVLSSGGFNAGGSHPLIFTANNNLDTAVVDIWVQVFPLPHIEY